jgi:type IV pilus assembly protein PilA
MTPPPPAPGAPQKNGLSTLVIVLIVLGVGFVPCTGILAAIAIPNFIRFQSRSKMAECKATLKALYTMEKASFADKGKYSTNFDELAVPPFGATQRYTYYLTPEAYNPATAKGAPSAKDGLATLKAHAIVPSVTDTGFTLACVGNIDNDSVLDVWTISSEERHGKLGEAVPSGIPYHDVDDIAEP